VRQRHRSVGVRHRQRVHLAAKGRIEALRTVFALVDVEPMTGIEPAYSAWEAALDRSTLFARLR